jgi:hypothetical protein
MNTRKWNKLLLGTAIVTLAIGVTYACKDFLNTTPQGVLNEDALATPDGVEGLLIAAYRSLDCSSSSAGSWGCAASNWVWGSVTSGDAHKGSNLGDQQPVNEIEVYLWGVGDVQDYLNQKWAQVYDGVARSNATIRLLDKVIGAGGLDPASAEAVGVRGEATFLRAHYHFEAYRMWENIPYYTEADQDYKKSNVGVDAIGNIVKDLKTAEQLLGTNPVPRGGDAGRATGWTAKAYRGRVYAYAAAKNAVYWDSAKVVLDSVVAHGPYALETSFDHVWTAFTQYQNGPETILAFQASVKDGEPSGWNSNWGERLNFPHSGSHFGCCGFHQPTFSLVNYFQVDANGLPLAETDPNWDSPTPAPPAQIPVTDTAEIWKGLNFIGGTMRPVDPRLDWTVGRDRAPYKDWGLPNRSWIRDASYSGPYSPKKNVQENAANGENNVGWQATQTNDVNMHIFRFGDLLLLNAEADAQTGDLAGALAIVNQIRARAGQVAQGCGQGFDATTDSVLKATWSSCVSDSRMAVPMIQGGTVDSLTTQWATYRIGLYASFPDQATALQAIKNERRLELAMEGQHFFDQRRWGDADTAITNYLTVEKTRIPYLAGVTFAARNHLYPIPAIQVELSKVGSTDMLVQNPGW